MLDASPIPSCRQPSFAATEQGAAHSAPGLPRGPRGRQKIHDFFGSDEEVDRPSYLLACSLIRSAIIDLESERPERRRMARDWLNGAPALLTFPFICDSLQIRPAVLLRDIARMTGGDFHPQQGLLK